MTLIFDSDNIDMRFSAAEVNYDTYRKQMSTVYFGCTECLWFLNHNQLKDDLYIIDYGFFALETVKV